jgi:predicted DCC family thiol-disulfide oxidoreductase YuxK
MKDENDGRKRDREVIVYDGECPVCRTLKGQAERRLDREKIQFQAFQTADLEELSPGLTPAMAEQAMYLVLSDGRRVGGARAFFAVMRQMKGFWGLVGRLLYPISPLLQPFYRFFARYRHLIAPLFEREIDEEE